MKACFNPSGKSRPLTVGRRITLLLVSRLTGLDLIKQENMVLLVWNTESKQVKHETRCTMKLPPMVIDLYGVAFMKCQDNIHESTWMIITKLVWQLGKDISLHLLLDTKELHTVRVYFGVRQSRKVWSVSDIVTKSILNYKALAKGAERVLRHIPYRQIRNWHFPHYYIFTRHCWVEFRLNL